MGNQRRQLDIENVKDKSAQLFIDVKNKIKKSMGIKEPRKPRLLEE